MQPFLIRQSCLVIPALACLSLAYARTFSILAHGTFVDRGCVHAFA
jgi:hypothetical protein